jgi:hypothetical protein
MPGGDHDREPEGTHSALRYVEIDSTEIVRYEPETGTFPSQVSPTSPESLPSPWQLDGHELRISQAYGPLDAMFHGGFSEDGDSFSGAYRRHCLTLGGQPQADRLATHGGSGSAHELHRPRAEDGRQERSASSRPAHRLDDDVDELASFCKGPALACGTGTNPGQPVDPDLDALDIAKCLEGVVHVDDQIAHHLDPGPGPS